MFSCGSKTQESQSALLASVHRDKLILSDRLISAVSETKWSSEWN